MKKINKHICLIQLSCRYCHNTYEVHPYRLGKSKYCSRSCTNKDMQGKIVPHLLKLRPLMKGANHPLFGKKLPDWWRKKISDNHADLSGDKSPTWKGDDVGYYGVHDWIYKEKGSPKKCELCKTTTANKYHWANRDHKYRRDINDWLRLCVPCHKKHDGHCGARWSALVKSSRWGKNI